VGRGAISKHQRGCGFSWGAYCRRPSAGSGQNQGTAQLIATIMENHWLYTYLSLGRQAAKVRCKCRARQRRTRRVKFACSVGLSTEWVPQFAHRSCDSREKHSCYFRTNVLVHSSSRSFFLFSPSGEGGPTALSLVNFQGPVLQGPRAQSPVGARCARSCYRLFFFPPPSHGSISLPIICTAH
jgi:hypothetical protein